MEILPIFSAIRRNPVGALLIALQIAVTMAVMCNASFVVAQQLQRMNRPTGIDEANILTFYNVWSTQSGDFKSRVQTDLATLRSLPGVDDATATLGLPLRGGGYNLSVALTPTDTKGITDSAVYPVDSHGMAAFGLQLRAGRGFTSDEIADLTAEHEDPTLAPVVLVTHALADRLFPHGDALGKPIYLGTKPSTIIGIVDRMQAAHVSMASDLMEYSILVPFQWEGSTTLYVVRTKPGQYKSVAAAIPPALARISRARVIGNINPFVQTRADAYRPFRAMVLILSSVCTLLLIITCLGIVGLTTYWVSQRSRQIGIRRALGARQVDILRYFHTENFLVVGAGAIAGIILGDATNVLAVEHFAMARMPQVYILASALIMLVLGQLSVLWPSFRAAKVPPALATRAQVEHR
ncbi:ABC transporter permease [Dyella flagellata]|uniref:ABC transporter permease n=1 Tax=Dyella flagellata TaxID=1867833 RepID=A0ABQ5X7W4_9GAMM|nr:FtsX-like permease family protein [Dyella flagellata]GLQ87730.1 ABC transporter permease [Dyella flagellata]